MDGETQYEQASAESDTLWGTGLVSPETIEDVFSTLKDSRNVFLRKFAE